MGIEKRLLASFFGAWMAISFVAPSAAFADISHKSASPTARPSTLIKARPAAKPANEKRSTSVASKSSKKSAVKVASTHVSKSSKSMPTSVHHTAVKPEHVKQAVATTSAVTGRTKGRIWCVPFAREVSGIDLQGNASKWWGAANNRYAKGQTPVVGSVLNFRATRKMPMGHVAVVSQVVNPRKILVDHANWRKNRVSLNMAVVDVSPRNDWSAVRVESVPNTLGDVYPTYGFIYRAADRG